MNFNGSTRRYKRNSSSSRRNDKKKAAGEMEYVKINLDEKRRITQI